jgi:hypothetical protein
MENKANALRGLALFTHKLRMAEQAIFDSDTTARLNALHEHYSDKVGVMGLDGLHPAARLADAVIAAGQESGTTVAEAIADVEARMAEPSIVVASSAPHTIVNRHFAHSTEPLIKGRFGRVITLQEDEQTKPFNSQAATYSDAQTNDASSVFGNIEVLDLIGDVDKPGLSLEGKRKLGLVAADADGSEADTALADDTVFGIMHIEDGEVKEIECPYCHAFDVYMIGYDQYGCFGCDKEFPIPAGISDIHDVIEG